MHAGYFSLLNFLFRNTIRVSNSLYPGQGTNCLQKLTADNKNCHSDEELKFLQFHMVKICQILFLVNHNDCSRRLILCHLLLFSLKIRLNISDFSKIMKYKKIDASGKE